MASFTSGRFILRETEPIHTGYKDVWALEPVWTGGRLCLYANFLFSLLFDPEGGINTFRWIIS
jgi:hypothetical protein